MTNYFRQTQIRTAEPLVPEPSGVEFEMAIEYLERYKPSCLDYIPAEVIQSGGRALGSELRELVTAVRDRNA